MVALIDSTTCCSCKGGSRTSGEGHPRMWAQGCSQTSGERTSTRTLPYANDFLLISSLLSRFLEKKYFHGNMGTYKIGELPQHSAIMFFCCGRSLKIHIENEKGVVYVASFFLFLFWFCLFVGDIFRGSKDNKFLIFKFF